MLRRLAALVGLLIAITALGQAQTLTLFASAKAARSLYIYESLRNETARLMAPAGHTLEWKSLNDPRSGESYANLVVAEFDGVCTISALAPPSESARLAAAAVSDGQVLPFIRIDCNRLRQMLDPVLAGRKPLEREYLFGRALGRVLAHELFHVLANRRDHEEQGVAKSCFSVRNLLDDDFGFDSASLEQMRPAPAITAALDRTGGEAGSGR